MPIVDLSIVGTRVCASAPARGPPGAAGSCKAAFNSERTASGPPVRPPGIRISDIPAHEPRLHDTVTVAQRQRVPVSLVSVVVPVPVAVAVPDSEAVSLRQVTAAVVFKKTVPNNC